MTDAEGLTTTYTYDALGRVIAETKSGGGVRPATTTATTYDIEDRILSRTVTSGNLSETETYGGIWGPWTIFNSKLYKTIFYCCMARREDW